MKKVLIIISILAAILVIESSLFICWFFKDDSIEQEELVIDLPMLLEKEVTTIKDGLDVSYDLAKRWDKNALSTIIIARFEGKEQMINKKGSIFYEFAVDKLGPLGNLGKTCHIKIDLNQQAIVEFEPHREAPDTGHNTPKDFYKANIDIEKAFEIVEKKLGKETLYKYKEPTVIITAGEDTWTFNFYNEEKKDYSLRINTNNGEIVDIKEK